MRTTRWIVAAGFLAGCAGSTLDPVAVSSTTTTAADLGPPADAPCSQATPAVPIACTSGAWVDVAVDCIDPFRPRPALALGADGRVHLFYARIDGTPKYASAGVGEPMRIEDLAPLGAVGSLSVQVDASGAPRIAYVDIRTNDRVLYAERGTSGWSLTPIDSAMPSTNVTIALDDSGGVDVAYSAADGLHDARRLASGAFSSVLVDGQIPTYPRQNALAFDHAGTASIVYTRDDASIGYAERSASAGWVTSAIPISESMLDFAPSLAFDASSSPHIAVMTEVTATSGGMSELVRDAEGAFIPTALPIGDVREDRWNAFDPAGVEHIVYFDALGVEHAQKSSRAAGQKPTATTWAVDTLQATDLAGDGISVATDAQGGVGVAYWLSLPADVLHYAYRCP